jgi:type II secretory pathway pseudopilin PulG
MEKAGLQDSGRVGRDNRRGAGSRREQARSTAALSLIELMVTITLLSVIMLGLLMMFNQTQRAFRSSMTQADVLEAGRAITEMMTREMEQITPSHQQDFVDRNQNRLRTTNFFAWLSRDARYNAGFDDPQFLGMPGTTYRGQPNVQDRRTNVVQRLFFLTKQNQDWIGIGYQVVPLNWSGMAGTLYRFSYTNRMISGRLDLSDRFNLACELALRDAAVGRPVTNMNRIADGVVNLQAYAYDNRGLLLTPDWPDPFRPISVPNVGTRWAQFRNWSSVVPSQVDTFFVSNAVPAEVEVELGILENTVYERFKAIGNAVAQRNYLSNHAAQVHIFRQRVSVRNVDPAAFRP